MTVPLNAAVMTVSGAPGTGTITLGGAVSGYQTWAAAGAIDGGTYSYRIDDGGNFELGIGTYTASGSTLTRSLVYSSTGSLLNASSAAIVSSVALATDFAGGTPEGKCRLVYSSSTLLTLQPYQGNQLWIAGANRTINSPTLSNAGLSASTLYYIYASWDGSTASLLASTTGHVTDPKTGVEIMSGDATKTLVGMIYTGTGSPGTFADSATQRYVASWFNRQARFMETSASGKNISATAASLGLTLRFVSWADEAVSASSFGLGAANSAASYVQIFPMVDGSTVSGAQPSTAQESTGGYYLPVSFSRSATLSENAHSVDVSGGVNSGTGVVSLTHNAVIRS